jgi:hypothetical protein
MDYNTEDAFLDSQWEERFECEYATEEDSRWEWTGKHDWIEDDEEEEEDGDEISDAEKYACDMYNERYSYPYCD